MSEIRMTAEQFELACAEAEQDHEQFIKANPPPKVSWSDMAPSPPCRPLTEEEKYEQALEQDVNVQRLDALCYNLLNRATPAKERSSSYSSSYPYDSSTSYSSGGNMLMGVAAGIAIGAAF